MKWFGLAAVSCAALLFAVIDEAAAGGRSSGRSSSGASRGHSGHQHHHRHHHHRHHFHSRIFIGAPLFWGPSYYYGPACSYPPPAPIYIEQEPVPQEQDSQYWYFCPSARTYYPYVGECPEGWQRVLPQPNPQPPAG